ncbi:MAG: hypothetical protein WCK90_03640 [archaeon]
MVNKEDSVLAELGRMAKEIDNKERRTKIKYAYGAGKTSALAQRGNDSRSYGQNIDTKYVEELGKRIDSNPGNVAYTEENKWEARGYANKLLDEGDAGAASVALRLYVKADGGLRDSVKRRVLRRMKTEYELGMKHGGADGANYVRKVRAEIEEVSEIMKLTPRRGNTLAEKVSGTAAVVVLAAGVFMLAGNLTGFVVADLAPTNSSILGSILAVVGLVGVYFSFGRR